MEWEFFWRFLFSKRAGSVVRRISWLSFAALTISIAALIIVISVMTALNRNMRSRLLAVEPHLVIEATEGAKWDKLFDEIKNKNVIPTDWKAYPFESQDVIIRTVEGRFRGALARGVTVDGLEFISAEIDRINKTQRKKPSQGEVATGLVLKESDRLEAGEILIGIDLAYMLGIFEGDSVTVVPPEGLLLPGGETPKFEKVRAREIMATNIQEFDGQGLFYLQGKTLASLKNSSSLRRGLEVWVPDIDAVDELKADLQKKLTGMPVKISNWRDRNAALFLSLKLEKVVITLFLSIAAIMAGFSLLIVLGLLISQKRREIGLLQAIGLSRFRCFQLFQGLALRLSGFGVGMGALIGVCVGLYMEKFPLRILPDIYYDAEVPAYVDPRFVFTVVAIGLLLSFIGGLMVTRPLASFNPTDLLRVRK